MSNLDPSMLAEIAAKKAVDSAHPQEIPPGKYTVILEPAAVLDIIGFMFWDYSGMAILDQRSFLAGRIGKKLFGDNITVWDDVAHPLHDRPSDVRRDSQVLDAYLGREADGSTLPGGLENGDARP